MAEPAALPSPVMIIGVSGFLGRHLAAFLAGRGVEVLGTTRSEDLDELPEGVSRLHTWNGRDEAELAPLLKGVAGVVNFAGSPLKTVPWTPAFRRRLRDSRIRSTAALMAALSGGRKTVRVLQGSAVGIYGDTKNRWVDEDSPSGRGFLAGLVSDWETAARELRPKRVSLALLRTGVVLSPDGGFLKRLHAVQSLGVTPLPGGGRQWLAWIHLSDYLEALAFLLADTEITGPVNLCAPFPQHFSVLAAAASRGKIKRLPLYIPAGPVRCVLGAAAEPLLEGQRARSKRLKAAGFRFAYPKIKAGTKF
ncbi:MAG TPA: TIGR01777 family protein [Candidatus Aminicenantes bacterium]|nr:TIGR01777 family protein [Candidatus Aminicenantes bacterium]